MRKGALLHMGTTKVQVSLHSHSVIGFFVVCYMHQDNMSVCLIPHYTPLLYSKSGVYRGIHYFFIFALKHILWVLARTASMRRF